MPKAADGASQARLVGTRPATIAETAPDGLELILVDRTSATPDAKFNSAWFLPALQRYRSTLLLVLGSSFVVQLFTLANPLLIQVIIDKVIAQRSLDTLQVLGIALVAVTIFEGLLGSLRTFMFADTTNRIDMRLGAEVIDHLYGYRWATSTAAPWVSWEHVWPNWRKSATSSPVKRSPP